MSWHSGDSSAAAAVRWEDDDTLAAELGQALTDDERRERVVSAARVAFRAHRAMLRELEGVDFDLLLLDLVHDSATEPELAGVRDRSGSNPRTLVFEGDGLGVELELDEAGIEGQLIPPRPGTVTLRTPDAEVATVETDEVGFFRFTQRPAGPLRLVCQGDEATCATEWLTP
jgi:hypothetical protein